MLIGKRLREARKAHNLSAEQLGNMIGVTKAAVWASFMCGVGITVSNMIYNYFIDKKYKKKRHLL